MWQMRLKTMNRSWKSPDTAPIGYEREIEREVKDPKGGTKIRWLSSKKISDGFFRPTPDEATTVYLRMYLGAFTDSDETIISISFKECINETMSGGECYLIENGRIKTSFSEGKVCLSYTGFATDTDCWQHLSQKINRWMKRRLKRRRNSGLRTKR